MTFEANASLGEFRRRNVSAVPETASYCLPQLHDTCRYVVLWNRFLAAYLTRCLCSLTHAFRCLSRPAASLAFTSDARREPHIIYDISMFVKLRSRIIASIGKKGYSSTFINYMSKVSACCSIHARNGQFSFIFGQEICYCLIMTTTLILYSSLHCSIGCCTSSTLMQCTTSL